MIEVCGLSKFYGRRRALHDVSLDVRPGEIVALLGPNGAGKSTLLRCILGVVSFEGHIRVGGVDPEREGRAVRRLIGYMPQAGGLHADLTVAETLRFYGALRGSDPARAGRLLVEAGLDCHADARVGELSGGLQQRLAFAVAALSDPPILLLDEPAASLDAAGRRAMAGRLRELASAGRAVLISVHSGHELLAVADRRLTIEDGHLQTDGPAAGPVAPSVAARSPAGGPAWRDVRRAARAVAHKEIRDALRNRWLAGYAVVLGLLGLLVAFTGTTTSGGLALQMFGRTTATLINLALLLTPLIALTMGAMAIAGERDKGTLEHLLAQPIDRSTLLLGKYAGLLLALGAATLAGFAPAGVLVALQAGPAVFLHYLLFPGLAAVLAAAVLGVGFVVSVTSRGGAQAQGTAVFLWFALVIFYDLMLLGTLALSSLPAGALAALLVANPVDATRVLAILALEPDLYLLGPAGAVLVGRLSTAGAALVLAVVLIAWTVVPLVAAGVLFRAASGRRLRRSAGGAGVQVDPAGRAGRGSADLRVGRVGPA
jgi:Cu-processing system permease protein